MELLLYVQCMILLVSSLYLLQLFDNSRCNQPPGPRPMPLIGNLLDLSAQPYRSLGRLAQRHGPLMTIHLGAVTSVVASSPDTARDILQRHDAAFSTRHVPDVVRACAHDSFSVVWLRPNSPQWRALRRVCSAELFSPRRLDAQQPLRREKARRLVSYVARLVREGAPVDVRCVVFTSLLNMLSCILFSADLTDLDDGRGCSAGEFNEAITEFTRFVGVPNISDFFPAIAPLDLRWLRWRLARVFTRLYAVFDEQIERRMREPPNNDFLDVLLDYRTEDGQGFDRQTLLRYII